MSWFIKASSESHGTAHKCMDTGSKTEEKSMATVSRGLFTATCPVTICLGPPVKQSVIHIRLKADPFILTTVSLRFSDQCISCGDSQYIFIEF